MLGEQKLKQWEELVKSFTPAELIWANGYLNGIVSTSTNKPVENTGASVKKITIAFGTETGNSKKLAMELAAKAKQKGIVSKVVGMDQYKLADLPKEEYFLAIVSTHGEGDPPEAAQKFYDHIHNNGFQVPQLKYSVLALGDTSYPLFCKTGEDMDKQFQKLGGKRIAPLRKCDVDYEQEAAKWVDSVLESLTKTADASTEIKAQPTVAPAKPAGKQYYTGKIQNKINLNASGSSIATYHIELAVEGVEYIAGDSIGIVPENNLAVVEKIIALAGADANKKVTWKNEETDIKTLLQKKVGIDYLLGKATKQYAALVQKELPDKRFDLIELLENYPLQDAAKFETFIISLNQIAPRVYNIASSPAAHPDEVHITVLRDEFEMDGQKKTGLCTAFLDAKNDGDEVTFFIQPNKRFRLPADDKNIIMIGPGTGVAPFRSFVSERDATGATGGNWLFFGNPDFTTDFLYQTEWQQWFATSVLTKINVAFVNDTDGRIKIQDKLLQQAKDLFEWIKAGAHIYLCGEKTPMGRDVELAMVDVLQKGGNLTAEEAQNYFLQLKDEGRYVKDLY